MIRIHALFIKPTLPIIASVLALQPPLHAEPLTLREAVRQALQCEPELLASQAKTESAAGRADQAGRWSNPEMQLSLEDWPLRHAGWNASKRLAGFSQTVPFPGKKGLERQIGANELLSSQAQQELRRIETVRSVKTAFYQVLAAEALHKVEKDMIRNAKALAAAAQKRVAAGAAAEQEGLRAQIPIETARLELAGAQRELDSARKTLAALLGRTDLDTAPLAGSLAETAQPALLKLQPAGHPIQKAARANVARARSELGRARLEVYPDVTVGVSAGKEAVTNETIGQFSVGIPLPILDNSSGKRREAKANLAAAEAEALAADLRIHREWSDALARVRIASEQARIYRERLLPKADEALLKTRAGFEEGKYTITDVIDTQQAAVDARIGYERKLLELNIAQADLEAVLGLPTP